MRGVDGVEEGGVMGRLGIVLLCEEEGRRCWSEGLIYTMALRCDVGRKWRDTRCTR